MGNPTPNFGFEKPSKGEGAWDIPLNRAFDSIDTIYADHTARLAEVEANPVVSTAVTPFVRQTVLSGRMNEEGYADFLEVNIPSPVALIPDMTSDTTPSGTIRVGSILSANYPAENAFNASGAWSGASANYTMWISNNKPAEWISYEFPTVQEVLGYTVQVGNTARMSNSLTAAPRTWTFEGSDDNVNWTVLDTRTDQVGWSNDEVRGFRLVEIATYKAYRLNITSNNGAVYTSIERLQFYKEEVEVNSITLKASDFPLRLTFAAGSDDFTPVDFTEVVSADVEDAWTELEFGKTNYLYIERNPVTGQLSFGSTVFQPHYGTSPDITFYEEYLADGPLHQGGVDHGAWPRYTSTTVPINSSLGVDRVLRAEWVGKYYWVDAQSSDNVFGNARMRMFVNGLGSLDITRFYSSMDEGVWEWVAESINPDWLNLNGVNEVGHYFSISSGWSEHTSAEGLKIRLYPNPEFVEGAHWFDTNSMKMFVGSPQGWVEKQRVFIGEVSLDFIGLKAVNSYAFLGRYDSGWFNVNQNTVYSRTHGLGVPFPSIKSFSARSTDGLEETIDLFSNSFYYSGNGLYYGASIRGSDSTTKIDLAATTYPWLSYPGPTSTTAQWRIVMERGF